MCVCLDFDSQLFLLSFFLSLFSFFFFLSLFFFSLTELKKKLKGDGGG